jgi:hypothetical protein
MRIEKLLSELGTKEIDRVLRELKAILQAVERLGGAGAGGAGRSAVADLWKGLPNLAKVGVVAGGAVLALRKLGEAASRAADQFVNFSRLKNALGSSGGTTAFLQLLGGTLGVDMAALAMRSLEATRSGLGAAAAARAGLSPQFELGTAVDRGRRIEILLEEMKRIAQTQGERAALGFARQAGIEEAFDFVKLQKETLATMRQQARLEAQMFSPERLRQAYAYNAQLATFNRQWERLVATIGTGVLPIANFLLKVAGAIFTPVVKGTYDFSGGRSGQDAARAAQNANTEAVRQLALEIRRLQGVYGGGARARSAIPAAFGPGFGFFLQDNLRAHTVKLGAYALAM